MFTENTTSVMLAVALRTTGCYIKFGSKQLKVITVQCIALIYILTYNFTENHDLLGNLSLRYSFTIRLLRITHVFQEHGDHVRQTNPEDHNGSFFSVRHVNYV